MSFLEKSIVYGLAVLGFVPVFLFVAAFVLYDCVSRPRSARAPRATAAAEPLGPDPLMLNYASPRPPQPGPRWEWHPPRVRTVVLAVIAFSAYSAAAFTYMRHYDAPQHTTIQLTDAATGSPVAKPINFLDYYQFYVGGPNCDVSARYTAPGVIDVQWHRPCMIAITADGYESYSFVFDDLPSTVRAPLQRKAPTPPPSPSSAPSPAPSPSSGLSGQVGQAGRAGS
jgi:hypothetical protein